MGDFIVFVAEKKDAALALASALSIHIKDYDGYLEDESNKYIYTWANGHLVGLKTPDEISGEWKDWKWDNMPIIPSALSLKPLPNATEQLSVISKVTKNCKLIVNFADPGPEGELVFLFIKTYLGISNIPIKRLWTPSLQKTAIIEAFQNMKDDSEYKYLQNMAIARALGDWIIGINSSRSITLLGSNQQSYSIGRVILVCLGLLYDREVARESFESETYFKIKGTFAQGENKFVARYIGPRISELEVAKETVKELTNQMGSVEWADQEKLKEPPKLLNLTDVCVIANQQLDLPPKKTAKILQDLYLKYKVITYPRTSSRLVTPNEFVHMRAAYRLLSVVYPGLKNAGDIDRLDVNDPRIFSKQLQFDHHAIIPEVTVPTEFDTAEEKAVYHLIVERFLLQFCESHKYINRKVTLTFDAGKFETSYKKVTVPGWKGIGLNFNIDHEEEEHAEEIDEVVVPQLPLFEQGAPVSLIETNITDTETKPPSLYTEGTLMKQMESVANLIEDRELKAALKDSGIGTSATRAETISKLKKNEYIVIDKKRIELTKLGKSIVELVRKSNATVITSPQFTGEWERSLEQVKSGKPAYEFQQYVIDFTTKFIEELKEHTLIDLDKDKLDCSCPKCGGKIKIHKKMYRCSEKECSFILWKTQFGKTISPAMLKGLVTKGETSVLTFKTKTGQRSYKAKFKMPADIKDGKLLIVKN